MLMHPSSLLSGSFRLLSDIAEEIDLPLLRSVLGIGVSKREPAFRHPAPEYVRFERPPVVEVLGPCQKGSGAPLEARVRYFEYGVASVELRMQYRAHWDDLVRLANHWIMAPELERSASHLLRERLAAIGPVLKKPFETWVSEDYYLVQVDPIPVAGNAVLSAEELVRERGAAGIVRIDNQRIS